jgi:hypothetical protein
MADSNKTKRTGYFAIPVPGARPCFRAACCGLSSLDVMALFRFRSAAWHDGCLPPQGWTLVRRC